MITPRALRSTIAACGLVLLLGVSGCATSAQSLALPTGHLPGTPNPEHVRPLGPADGRIAGQHVNAFDTKQPAIANLDPRLRAALQQATRSAAKDGITMLVTSGWRSRTYQQELLDEAVGTYGSLGEAEKWVATPDLSAHVRGEAVDVGPLNAASWLHDHGAAYGLCQTYGNEIWHYQLEVRPGQTCPTPRTDAAN